MPAPAHIKTWQFSLDNLIPASDATTEKRALLFGIVNALLTFGSNPMTCSGSSNGTTFGMDGVNRWVTAANIVNNSWIVLRDAQVNPKYEICIRATSVSSSFTIDLVVSRLAGFGTVNGGTDGTVSVRPTATDQHIAITATNFGTGTTLSKALRFYVWRSADGQVTRVLWRNVTDATWQGVWWWGKPRNPISGWTDPVFYIYKNSALTGFQAESFVAYRGGVQVTTIEAHVNAEANNSDIVSQVNDWGPANTVDQYRVWFNSRTLAGSKGGIIGEFFDTRAVPTFMSEGSRAPATSPFTWVVVQGNSQGNWLFPSPDAALKLTAAP